jgi:SAM-dependent methyltransferase
MGGYERVGYDADMNPRPAHTQTLPATGGPSGFDPGVAHPARVYNYWVGGKDHYLADRAAGDEVARCRPHVVAGARANRAFLARAVRYLAADCGIRQFLDIGTGLPAPGSTHELAQQIAPGCKVAYVDNDPLVLVHARALLTSGPEGRCGYIDADLRDPAAVLAQASATLDFAQPVGVLLLAILHFLSAAENPAGVVAALARALAPGSYLAISHLTADFAPSQVGAAVEAYNGAVPGGVMPRGHAEVTALFGGLPLIPPGVVPLAEWRTASAVGPVARADLYAGIARTPPHACASTTRLGVLIG